MERVTATRTRQDLELLARKIRARSLRMVTRAKASHIGGSLSAADILAVLYGEWLRISAAQPDDPLRDFFILSKGHAAAAMFATLAECGFIPERMTDTYCESGSQLIGHVTKNGLAGIEFSTGSLGHGLPVGTGLAYDIRSRNEINRVVVLLSDGELNEGSVWEALLFAGHHKLSNLVAIVDYNKIQSYGSIRNVLDLEPLAAKGAAFKWKVVEFDGHNIEEIRNFLSQVGSCDMPTLGLAHTIKGKGIHFMENELLWHYRNPSPEQLATALAALESEVK